MIKKKQMPEKFASQEIDIAEYATTLAYIKKQIQEAQVRASFAVNAELLKLYWLIGKTVVEKQEKNNWGTNTVEKLAEDLQNEFPGLKGFSRANLFKMRSFYLAYEKVSQAVKQLEDLPIFGIPWTHNVILVSKVKNNEERFWYASKAIEYGWSRSMLEIWIESDLYHREGKAPNNFKKTLPSPHSDMVNQALKDPYLFDFLTLNELRVERDVEQGLIDHIQKFLLELGEGFAFIGRQVHLHVGDDDYYLDLLFYHVRLRCYFVVELKNTAFKPEYAGKLNFYLSAVDDLLRHADDKPTIGLLLCKTKNNFTAEYALRDINKPIGVAEYTTKLVEKLPKELRSLPTIEEIENELEKQLILDNIE